MSLLKFLHRSFGYGTESYFTSLFENIKSNITVIDGDFDAIFPYVLQKFTRLHFSPIEVSKYAANFLTENKKGAKILDIGSGAGKFCFVGSLVTDGYFVGVEQRESLHTIANEIVETYHLQGVEFLFDNIINIPFDSFDGFYIFNSFYENVSFDDNITDEVNLKQPNYDAYSTYVKEQLDKMPVGTRLATYFCSRSIAPDSYVQVENTLNENLKLWEKEQ
jgi:Protein-L-isoaspartate(D-aspartate) O-methyltransferase (PCMT)